MHPGPRQDLFWVFWTNSGPTSLLDMCTASGGGALGQVSPAFQPCLHAIPLTRLPVLLFVIAADLDVDQPSNALAKVPVVLLQDVLLLLQNQEGATSLRGVDHHLRISGPT